MIGHGKEYLGSCHIHCKFMLPPFNWILHLRIIFIYAYALHSFPLLFQPTKSFWLVHASWIFVLDFLSQCRFNATFEYKEQNNKYETKILFLFLLVQLNTMFFFVYEDMEDMVVFSYVNIYHIINRITIKWGRICGPNKKNMS